jgi:5-methylcytosine-specific restriction endonuclease McrA
MSRSIPLNIRRKIVATQKYRCNNRPNTMLRNLDDFECPLWKREEDPGIFDVNGFEIDHIIEFKISQDNSEENLQALCRICHKEKTKQFMFEIRKKTC